MIKMAKTYILSTVLLSAFMANIAIAAETKPSVKPETAQMPARVRPIDQLKQQLSLTDDQVKAVEKIQQDAQNNAMEARKAAANGEFKGFLELAPDSKEYDENAKKMADKAATRARNNVLNMTESRKKVYAVLNAEQKKKFLAMKPKPAHAINPQIKGEKPAVE